MVPVALLEICLILSVYCVVRIFMEVTNMSRITIEEVKHVANLARLAITEEEATKFQKQLDAIISFAEELNEIDTEGIEPTSHVLDMKNVLREDKSTKGLPVEEVLRNAPDHQEGQIKVPSIME